MLCSKCSNELNHGAKFCSECGAPVDPSVWAGETARAADPMDEAILSPDSAIPAKTKRKRRPTVTKMMKEGETVSPNIVLCEDGKYRWQYDLNLFTKPYVFLLVWKIFFFILLGIFAVMTIVDVAQNRIDGEAALNTLKMFGYFIIGMTVLVILGYLLYAAIMGGKYSVIFEMDDEGINHKQTPKQAKRARTLGILVALAGAAGGRVSTVGAGLAATRTEMYTEFDRVRVMKVYPKRGMIKLNAFLDHNQVYAKPEDFDFVCDYISARVPEGARKN